MAFLRLNGWAIPVEAGSGGLRRLRIGEKSRAFSGGLLSDRRATKRIWDLKTTPQTEMVAKAIEGLIEGSGDVWSVGFSDDALLTSDFFTAKGNAPGSTVGSIRFGVGADSDDVVDSSGKDEAKFGNSSLTVDPAATNILPANARDLEGPSAADFAAVAGGAIVLVTSDFLQGAKSLRVTTAASGDGAETNFVGASASTAYSASVYVKTTVARAVTLKLIDDVGQIALTNFTTVANKWNLLTINGTSAGGATQIKVQILDNAAGGTIIFCDAFQIEANSKSTTWVDGTRAAGDLGYPAAMVTGLQDMTINFWAKLDTSSTRGIFIHMIDSVLASGEMVLDRPSGAPTDFRWRTVAPNTTHLDDLTVTGVWDGDWHMITCVLRRNPETGESIKEVYVDGVTAGTSTPTGLPIFSLVETFRVGHIGGFGYLSVIGVMDDLMLVPFAVPAGLVAGWFALGIAMSLLPRLMLDGDIIPEASATVEGEVSREGYLGAAVDSGAFIDNARRIEFTIEEV